jgi:hypothetical protein
MKKLGKAILLVSLAAAGAVVVAQEKGRFEPRPITAYPARQTAAQVTIAVEAYDTGEKVKRAFGKTDPLKLGLTPIFVLIANDSRDALRLDHIRVQLTSAGREIADAVSTDDIRSGRVQPPEIGRSPGPIPGIGRVRKPKDLFEINERAFVAPAVEAGGQAYGFFYFRVARDQLPGARVYITGLRDARTGRDLLYFEIALHANSSSQ